LFRRKRRNKELDEVSTAIPGGVAAWNVMLCGGDSRPYKQFVVHWTAGLSPILTVLAK